jgi:hypothetical protein
MAYVPVATDGTNPLDTTDRSTAAAEFRALKTYLQTLLQQMFATGDVVSTINSVAPTGWLMVSNAPGTISRTGATAALATMILAAGSPWGVGDGSTTIGMPYIPAGYTWISGALGVQSVGSVISHAHGQYESGAVNAGGGYAKASTNTTTTLRSALGNTDPVGGVANLAAGEGIYWKIKL